MEMEGFEKRVLQSPAWRIVTQHTVLPYVLGVALLPGNADVLEVGAGGGFNAEAMLERFPGWRLWATDYDLDMVERARERLARFGDRAVVERADATALGFAYASFDIVVAIGVWHHVGDWRKALAESARALRPGGRLLVADLLPGVFHGVFGRMFPPAGTYSIDEVRAALPEAGFARWRLRQVGPLWYRLVAETSRGPGISSGTGGAS